MKNSIRKISMKSTAFVSGLICTVFSATAQIDSASIPKQYLFPEFSMSVIKLKSGSAVASMMNYNTLTEKMILNQKGALKEINKPEGVDTIIMKNKKFVYYDNAFYELAINAPVSLFIQHKCDLVSTGKPGAYGTKSQTTGPTSIRKLSDNDYTYNLKLPEEFVVTPSPVNWIRIDSSMQRILTVNQLLKLFPDHKGEIKGFIKESKINIKKEDDMIKLVTYCNQIYKR